MADNPALYPPIEPYMTGMLAVDGLHTIYFEQCGNENGAPAVFVHGGPGAGTGADDRRYFDPSAYRVVLFHQRGSGNSTPHAELKDNTTWDLVADMEKLREHLNLDKWVVYGGSWGSTLSLAYAQAHPERVKALVLRGIFMLRRHELEFFYQRGANFLFPDAWENYRDAIPEVERHDFMSAYHRRLVGPDKEEMLKCAKAWARWEMATAKLFVDPSMLEKADGDEFALAFARIECHYFVNGGFFRNNSQLLDDVEKIRHIPCTIVQGRYDVVCPMTSAWDLHRKWPEAEFLAMPDAGHSATEKSTSAALVQATDKYKTL